jgi:hypothetical protein
MKIKTFIPFILLLHQTFLVVQCKAPKEPTGITSAEQAEEFLAKEQKKKSKIAKKEKKRAYKNYWKMQSKTAKKSIKRNAKRQKRIARAKKRN